MSETPKLSTARTEAEILEAVARWSWYDAGHREDCPPEKIPAAEDLAEWLPSCPPDGHDDLVKFLNRLGDFWEARWIKTEFVNSGGTRLSNLTTRESVPLTPVDPDRTHSPGPVQAMIWDSNQEEIEIVRFKTFLKLHAAWLKVGDKHPVASLVRSWQNRPEPIRNPDKKDYGITPQGLFPDPPQHKIHRVTVRTREASRRILIPGYTESQNSQLPLFPAGVEDFRPAPLRLADAAGFGALKPGRGARLDKRLLLGAVLSMPRDQRRPGGRYTLRRTVRELARELWKLGTWRPARQGESLLIGLEALYYARVILPDGGQWVPAVVRRFPNVRDPKSEAVIELALPEEADHGPRIYRPQLNRQGLISDPAYDLWLALAYYWDRAKASNGGFRIYATRPKALRNGRGHLVDTKGAVILARNGRPVTDWRDPRAVLIGEERHPQANKVRRLNPAQLRRLAFAPGSATTTTHKRNQLQTVRRLLRNLERAGLVVIEEEGPARDRHWRVLEVRHNVGDRATL